MYWDITKSLTYNALFTFIVGNRGAGKTYNSTKWAIKDFLKTGAQFIYVRRYDEEFKRGKKEKFFDAIIKNNEFPDHEFKVKGYTVYIDNKPAGQFMALSKAKIEKSVAFPNVNKIIFDEFILDNGFYHYIRDEVMNFLDLYETVARDREGVRAYFLSNAITITNPYFLYFKMRVENDRKFQRFKNGEIIVEMVQDEEFIEHKKQTRFGRLIDGTEYGNYAIENKFLRDNDTFIMKKTAKARNFFILKYNGNSYGIWIDYSEGKYFVSQNIDPFCKIIYSITLQDHSPNTMLLKGGQSRNLKEFIENYKLGNVYYENINVKNVVYEIVRLSLL